MVCQLAVVSDGAQRDQCGDLGWAIKLRRAEPSQINIGEQEAVTAQAKTLRLLSTANASIRIPKSDCSVRKMVAPKGSLQPFSWSLLPVWISLQASQLFPDVTVGNLAQIHSATRRLVAPDEAEVLLVFAKSP